MPSVGRAQAPVEIIVSTGLHVRKDGIDAETLEKIREAWTYPNPVYDTDQRLREREIEDYEKAKEEGRTMKIRFAFRDAPPETIQGYDEDDDWLSVPRGTGTRSLTAFLNEGGYEVYFTDNRCVGEPIDVQLSDDVEWEPYLYQSEAAKALHRDQRGYILAPTAAGKTVAAMVLIAKCKVVTLVIAHTTEILDGWLDEIQGNDEDGTFAKLSPVKVTRIQGTKGALKAAREGQIILATIQTLYRCKEDVWSVLNRRVGLCLNDETHHAPADTFWDVLNRTNAKWRTGFTATDKRKDRLHFLLNEVIGPKVYEVNETVLMRSGVIERPHVTFVATQFYPHVMHRDRSGERVANISASREIAESKYNRVKLLNMMAGDEGRNSFIADQMEADWKNGYICAAVTERVRHAELLADVLRDRGMVVAVMKGGATSKKKRAAKRKVKQDVANGRIDAVIGTSVFDEGVNFPRLSAMHMTMPANNEGKVVQQIGRIRRREGKSPPLVRDYVDFRCKAVIASYQNRRKWYRRRKWPVTDINLKELLG